eukprot:TRINITY_DN9468_c0_g2_i3.p1 TRINITY_DN9468_c0_g2~~TRINITY_DN9468_c0_g2_i3.p1  ORF type:complete len:256 (-),score=12.45 TRINITY_DN9468_c0_g2_i3:138-905(-)
MPAPTRPWSAPARRTEDRTGVGTDAFVPLSDLLEQITCAREQPRLRAAPRKPSSFKRADPPRHDAGRFVKPSSVGRCFQPPGFLGVKSLNGWDQQRVGAPKRVWPSKGVVGELYDSARKGREAWKPAGEKEWEQNKGILSAKALGAWDAERATAPERVWPAYGVVGELYDERRRGQPSWKPTKHAKAGDEDYAEGPGPDAHQRCASRSRPGSGTSYRRSTTTSKFRPQRPSSAPTYTGGASRPLHGYSGSPGSGS